MEYDKACTDFDSAPDDIGYKEHLRRFKVLIEKKWDLVESYLAMFFWVKHRAEKINDIEFVASQTLGELERLNEDREVSWKGMEKLLFRAVEINKIDRNKIANSRIIRDQLQSIRRKETREL